VKKIRQRQTNRLFLRFIVLCLLMTCLTACRHSQQTAQPGDEAVKIDLQMSPQPPTVGDGTLVIRVIDQAGTPIRDARIEVRGDMTHAGMAPVSAIAQGTVDDEYRIPFRWTMAGDWVVSVNVALSSGETIKKTFDVTITSP
jgi:hypothetical protein